MPGEDEAFIHARVIEEPIGRFGGRPVLACCRQRRPDLLTQLAEQLAKPRLQSLVRKLTPLNLSFDPAFHGHGPPSIPNFSKQSSHSRMRLPSTRPQAYGDTCG